jgi:serine/threonine-protein kinase
VVHRDLKPDNIFLVRDAPKNERVKVLDFGIAKLRAAHPATDDLETATGQPLGTPSYMAPEQCLGETVTHATDVWSLGVVLYELLSGELPVQAKNYGQLVKQLLADDIAPLDSRAPDVPAEVLDLVRRMLTYEAAQRPALDEVATVLGKHSELSVPSFGMATTVQAPSGDEETAEAESSEQRAADASAKARAVVVVDGGPSDPEAQTKQQTSASFALQRTADDVAAPPVRKASKVTWIAVGAGLTGLVLLAWSLGTRPAEAPPEVAASPPAQEPTSEASPEPSDQPAPPPSDTTTVSSSAVPPARTSAPRPAPRLPRPPRPAPTAEAIPDSPYGDEPPTPSPPPAKPSPPPKPPALPPTTPKVITSAPF